MHEYSQNDLLRLAKRFHNTKRTYLLVNPLQGKHIPVSPGAALEMLGTLGRRLAEVAPEIDLVIGFAETATAVGAAVAHCLGRNCLYIHTTREAFACSSAAVPFQEEHSHATDQFLCSEDLGGLLRSAHAVAFVDDEISTGKTLLNIIDALHASYPQLHGKPIWAVSVISRLSREQLSAFRERGIECCHLLRLPLTDYSAQVAPYRIAQAELPPDVPLPAVDILSLSFTSEARHGVDIRQYHAQCELLAAEILRHISHDIAGRSVTVLGTEEYMYPGMILGEMIEHAALCPHVDCHATTRSPIGLCQEDGYPIVSGCRLSSFYNSGRDTYIYNLLPVDIAVILTDSPDDDSVKNGLHDLTSALVQSGCQRIILVREAQHVRNL